jgi:cytochrome oxidase Cu insertion factor (SCO1/SenC/PrrC family)
MKILLLILVLGTAALAQSAAKPTDPLKAGDAAPDFELNDQSGRPFKLSTAEKNVVLVFYRGYW